MMTVNKIGEEPGAHHVYRSSSHEPVIDQRKGRRYRLKTRVELLQDGKVVGDGQIINISKSGAAMRTDMHMNVSDRFELLVQRVGRLNCTIIRRFTGNAYGVRFDDSESTRYRMEKRLIELARGDGAIIELAVDNDYRRATDFGLDSETNSE